MVRRQCYGDDVRSAAPVLLLLVACLVAPVAACNDLREFRGTWRGARVGNKDALLAGISETASATLAIDQITEHHIEARLTVDALAAGTLTDVAISSLAPAEADVLAGITHNGNPLRVYLAFAPMPGGAALVVISLYDDQRIELRLVRGGDAQLYGVFALREQAAAPAASP